MDFVTCLALSHGFNNIFVFVHHLTKIKHLITCNRTAGTEVVTTVFLTHVWKRQAFQVVLSPTESPSSPPISEDRCVKVLRSPGDSPQFSPTVLATNQTGQRNDGTVPGSIRQLSTSQLGAAIDPCPDYRQQPGPGNHWHIPVFCGTWGHSWFPTLSRNMPTTTAQNTLQGTTHEVQDLDKELKAKIRHAQFI